MAKVSMKKANNLKAELNELADNLVTDPDELDKFVEHWTQGFHNYSLNNMLLAYKQKPDFKFLAGYKAWKQRGRQVAKGEHSIRILAPCTHKVEDEETGDDKYVVTGFRSVPVFDVSQTGVPVEGKDPETGETVKKLDMSFDDIELGAPDMVKGASKYNFSELCSVAPVPVEVAEDPTSPLSNGSTDGRWITITPKSREEPMIATLFHETAHILLGHTGAGAVADNCSQSAREIEADAVSYVVCKSLGIENDKARYYISNWGGNKEELTGRGPKILSVASRMVKKVEELGE